MVKDSPGPAKIAVMAAFALSCVGILLYLWLTFGGSIPLKPQGYQVHVRFNEATQLVQQADVRISGVNVGKVRKKTEDRKTGQSDATLEIDSRYAPIPKDTRAILRQKTLLGETYVELTPGNKSSGNLPDGGTLAQSQVAPTVELDEIFRAFDPKTRDAFRTWLSTQGRAIGNRGRELNVALGSLTPFADETEDVLRIVKHQSGDTRRLVRNTGVVFNALSQRQGQLRGLISNSNRVFETTAARDRELADTFTILPTFLNETRTTVRRTSRFAANTNPLITQLRPAARELSPTLIQLRALAPDLRGLFRDLGPLIKVSRKGLPALEHVLDDTRPLLARLDPFIRTFQPITDYLGLYKHEIAAFFSLDAASAQVNDQPEGASRPLHYLRTTNPINPEVLAAYPKRLPTVRSNPYVEPGGYKNLRTGLKVFGSYLCKPGNDALKLSPLIPANLKNIVNEFVLTSTGPVAPPCKAQRPLGRLVGQSGVYPQLKPIP